MDWFEAGLRELDHNVRPLRSDRRRNKVALARWEWWRRFLRRHGWPVPLFMRPWDRQENER
jgi:hypothetical protein